MANAHATWITQRTGDWAVVHGEGSTDEAYDPINVTTATGHDAAGAVVEVALAPQTKNTLLTPTGEAAALAATFDEGWWIEDAAGESHNAAPEGFADFKSAGKYATYTVSYIKTSTAQAPFGLKLEIVPLADPVPLMIGDKLPVQVLLDGKPLAGVSVTSDMLTDWDIGSPVTDSEGKTTITIANTGLNVAQVYREVPSGDKPVDGLQAVLAFAAQGPAEE